MNIKTLADYDREGADEDNFTWEAFDHCDESGALAAADALRVLAETWSWADSGITTDYMVAGIDRACHHLRAWKEAVLVCEEYQRLKTLIAQANADEDWLDVQRMSQRLDTLRRSQPNLAALLRAYEANMGGHDEGAR